VPLLGLQSLLSLPDPEKNVICVSSRPAADYFSLLFSFFFSDDGYGVFTVKLFFPGFFSHRALNFFGRYLGGSRRPRREIDPRHFTYEAHWVVRGEFPF